MSSRVTLEEYLVPARTRDGARRGEEIPLSPEIKPPESPPPNLSELQEKIWKILHSERKAFSAQWLAERIFPDLPPEEMEVKVRTVRQAANKMAAQGIIVRWDLECPDGIRRVYYSQRMGGQTALHRIMIGWVTNVLDKYNVNYNVLNQKFVPDLVVYLPNGTNVAIEVETGLKRASGQLEGMVKRRLTKDGYDSVLVIVPDEVELKSHRAQLRGLVGVEVIRLADLEDWIKGKVG